MMTYKPTLLILVAALISILGSCAEDPDEPYHENTRSLTGGSSFGRTWQISSIEIELGTVDPHSCVKDNYFTYYPDGTYEVNEGRSKCDPRDPPAWSGTWSYGRNQTELVIVIGDSTRVWELDRLTSNFHKISSDFNGDWRTYHFVH